MRTFYPWSASCGAVKFAYRFGLGLVVVGAVVGANEYRLSRQVSEIRAKVAVLKAKGWPTSGDDMPKGPPAEKNAFLVLAPHIAKNRETYEPKDPVIYNVDPLPLLDPADEKYLRDAVALNQGLLDITARAFREKSEYFIPHKWDSGMMLLLPEYAGLKGLQKLILAQVTLDIRAGKMESARERLGWIHRIQAGLASEPIVIGRMVLRSMMVSERQLLLKLHEQGQPVLPLLRESVKAWRGYPCEIRPLVATEMMSTLATIRYLDTGTFWRFQSLPWSLFRKPENIEEGASVKPGDYVPKVGAARAKLSEALDGYLEMDRLVGGVARPGHLTKAMESNEKLWSTIPAFSGFAGGSMSSEPTVGGSIELLRLEPAVLDLFVRLIEQGGKVSSIVPKLSLGELERADGLVFDLSTDGERAVLLAREGVNEVARATYPTDLSTPYRSVSAAREGEIKNTENGWKAAKSRR